MTVTTFQINEDLTIASLPPEAVAEVCQDPDARIWVDLHHCEPEELEAWLEKLGIQNLTRRLCLEARDRSAFYPLNEEILLVIPAQVETDGPTQTDYLAFLCRENLLMTIHLKPVFRPEHLAMLRESQEWLAERSIAAIVAGVMIDLSLEGLRRNTELRDSILALEERMDQKPDTVHADDILELRAELLMLSAVVSDQLPALQALNVTEKPFFQLSQSGEHLNCAVANLQAADGSLGRLDKRIVALRTGFQMHAQEKTNRRLGMLTILSAIFMPITLMAGIWGMNFENMPELKQPYAYPVALGAMALIGAGMFRFFRTNRWFD